jgi:hypothetical protein
MGHVL